VRDDSPGEGWKIEDGTEVNQALQRQPGVSPNTASSMRRFYVEAAAHLFPTQFKHDFVTFYHYENFDTQHRMPSRFLPPKQSDRSAHTVEVTMNWLSRSSWACPPDRNGPRRIMPSAWLPSVIEALPTLRPLRRLSNLGNVHA
jgi:hypothetical protein